MNTAQTPLSGGLFVFSIIAPLQKYFDHLSRVYTACDSWDILKPSPTMDGSKTNNSKALHTNRCFHQSMSETFVNIIGWQWPITDRALIWNRLFSQHKKQKTILRELWNYVITWFVEQSISSSSVRNTLVLSCVYHMQCSACHSWADRSSVFTISWKLGAISSV